MGSLFQADAAHPSRELEPSMHPSRTHPRVTHRERLQACLRGEIIDYPPIALWKHFPIADQTPETLAAATIEFQRAYEFDLVKVTPPSSYCLKDWGSEDVWDGASDGARRYSRRVIAAPEDWARLPVLEANARHLTAQLHCLELVRAALDPDTPVIQTIFSPLAQAKNLAGNDLLIEHLRRYPDLVRKGLETLAETTRNFIRAASKTGIDGIFYAVQHAQAQFLTEAEFAEFGVAFDLHVLDAATSLWFNMLHLHGENVYFDLARDYPVQCINWHDHDTLPSLGEAKERFPGVVCGGIKRETLAQGSRADVVAEVRDALARTGRTRCLIGAGCVMPIAASHQNIVAAIERVRSTDPDQ